MVKLYGTIQELSALDKNILQASILQFGTNAERYTDILEDEQGLYVLLNEQEPIVPVSFLTPEQQSRAVVL